MHFFLIFHTLDPDPWIRIFFADPDPGSQNLADPTDPDPKHWFLTLILLILIVQTRPGWWRRSSAGCCYGATETTVYVSGYILSFYQDYKTGGYFMVKIITVAYLLPTNLIPPPSTMLKLYN